MVLRSELHFGAATLEWEDGLEKDQSAAEKQIVDILSMEEVGKGVLRSLEELIAIVESEGGFVDPEIEMDLSERFGFLVDGVVLSQGEMVDTKNMSEEAMEGRIDFSGMDDVTAYKKALFLLENAAISGGIDDLSLAMDMAQILEVPLETIPLSRSTEEQVSQVQNKELIEELLRNILKKQEDISLGTERAVRELVGIVKNQGGFHDQVLETRVLDSLKKKRGTQDKVVPGNGEASSAYVAQ